MSATIAVGAAMLSACSNSPQEQAADNIQANAESVADNLEAAAENASSPEAAGALQNQADETRNLGDAQAEDLTTHDADTNLSNGL
jgi:hypothetical protein